VIDVGTQEQKGYENGRKRRDKDKNRQKQSGNLYCTETKNLEKGLFLLEKNNYNETKQKKITISRNMEPLQKMHDYERMRKMIKVGIIGATGYAGAELVRLLLQREDVEIVWYGSRSYVGQDFASVYRNVVHLTDEPCKDDDMATLAEIADVIFTATPQGFCASQVTEEILSKTKIIDLSADFRIKDVNVYEKWYKISHATPQFIPEAVYGLPEINRDKIKNARLIANPGCYPTCSFLSVYPMVKEGLVDPNTLIIDAKSGTSGAGRSAKVDSLYCEVNESMKPYGVATHRHTPEIEEQLSYAAGKPVTISFTPHLVPMNRGILATAYATLTRPVTTEEVKAVYDKYYGNEYFVRVLKPGEVPQTRWVEGSNFADVAFKIDERTNRIVMMGAIDNMVKGAAGQAMQNMNLLFGLPENTGLKQIPVFP
jgi:N-acetyl-gamma-glutamyl-phosphate reductase